jgi:hypothetical protein
MFALCNLFVASILQFSCQYISSLQVRGKIFFLKKYNKEEYWFQKNSISLRHILKYCLSIKIRANASKNEIAATWSQEVCLLSHCDS